MNPDNYQQQSNLEQHTPEHKVGLEDTVIWISNELQEVSLHKRIIRKGLLVCAVLVVAEVLVQLFYPHNWLLPNTRIAGRSLSFATRQEAAAELSENQIPVLMKAGSMQPSPSKLSKLGLATNSEKTVKELTSYSFFMRMLPFSILAKHSLDAPIKDFNQNTFASYEPKLQEQFSVQPKDATIDIEDGKVVVTNEQDGWQLDAEKLAAVFQTAAAQGQAIINLPISTLHAQTKGSTLEKARSVAEAALNTSIEIKAGDTSLKLEKPEVSNWITFAPGADGSMEMQLDEARIEQYLANIKTNVESAAAPSVVSLVDNRVQSTKPGKAGTVLDVKSTANAIKEAVAKPTEEPTVINAAIIQTPPSVQYSYSYTPTNEGLNALLTNSVKGRAGSTSAGVQVLSANDGRHAIVNSKQVVAASLYKLFIAQVLFEKMGAGQLSWSSQVSSGETITQCFDKMIVMSDERCAALLAQEIGWAAIDNRLAQLGYSSTRINNYNADGTFNGNKLTSVQDVILLLDRLYDGTFAKGELNDALISAMKRQVYRKGIPTGAKGQVADKVGFIFQYINDAGIVYGANKHYALVIMTNNSSWSSIAAITKQIDGYLGN